MNDSFDKEIDDMTCPAIGYQDVNVCVPVTIKPFGDVGNATTQCIGRPIVTSENDRCCGEPGGVCKFTISQKLRIEVPVMFGARAEIGDVFVGCECARCNSECDV
jgi:hypothetical protein